MTLKYELGDVVVLAENVEQNWRKTFVPGVAVKIDQLCDFNSDDEHYTVRLVSDPSDYWYIVGNEIDHEATEALQTSNESGYLVQKSDVENDVVSSSVNTSDNEETKMKFKVGDKVILADMGYAKSFFPRYNGEELTIMSIEDDSCGGFLVETDSGVGAYDCRFRLVEDAPKSQDNSWYEKGELPPVGANIEYKLGDGPWYEATVKYVLDVLDGDEDEIVIACPHLGFEQLLVLDKHTKIRPIQTPEQIAEQEREKVIDAISDVLIETERMSNYTDVAAHLYESGLRFVEEGVE